MWVLGSIDVDAQQPAMLDELIGVPLLNDPAGRNARQGCFECPAFLRVLAFTDGLNGEAEFIGAKPRAKLDSSYGISFPEVPEKGNLVGRVVIAHMGFVKRRSSHSTFSYSHFYSTDYLFVGTIK